MSSRDKIKYLYYGFFKLLGCYRYNRFKNRDKPIVLTYHGILPEIPTDQPEYEYRNFVTVQQFERHIRFLLKNYRPLSVSDFFNGNTKRNRGFLITFDDGFQNNYSYALPVLQKYNLQAIFFITTNFIGSRELLWTEQVTCLIQQTNKTILEVDLDKKYTFHLDSHLKKEQASDTLRKYLKRLPPIKRNKIIEELKSQLNDVQLIINKDDEERYLFMNWEEVKKMISAGQVIGSHTHTHPMLSTLSDEESLYELKQSKEAIEKNTNEPCDVMSYPNGEKEDYTDIQKKQLREIGYKCAFTQISPYKNFYSDLFELNRINISLKMDRTVFEAKICGFK